MHHYVLPYYCLLIIYHWHYILNVLKVLSFHSRDPLDMFFLDLNLAEDLLNKKQAILLKDELPFIHGCVRYYSPYLETQKTVPGI